MSDSQSGWKTAGWIVVSWLAAHVVLIAGHVLVVLIYSIAVAPGLASADYQEFAQRSGPWFSIIFGGPVFYALGRFLARRAQPRGRLAALVAWSLYSVTDLVIVLAFTSTISPLLVGQWIASQAIKLVAVWLATSTASTVRSD